MLTFLLSLVLLIAGYFVYGAIVEKVFKPDPTELLRRWPIMTELIMSRLIGKRFS